MKGVSHSAAKSPDTRYPENDRLYRHTHHHYLHTDTLLIQKKAYIQTSVYEISSKLYQIRANNTILFSKIEILYYR